MTYMSVLAPARPSPASELPVFDISRLRSGPEERASMARGLREILHRFGFFYLVGHGVEQGLIDETLAVAKRFFALPEAAKRAIDITRSAHFRGYTAVGGELTGGKQDWREQVDFDCEEEVLELTADSPAWHRAIGPNQWPADLPELQPVITRYQAAVTRLGVEVLEAVALALGQDRNAFAPLLQPRPRQHLKILRYPGRDVAQTEQGVGAHKDGGLVTILLQDKLPGLRVLSEDGEWIEAPPVAGTFVVNTGELLELATDGFVRADVHAAIVPPAGMERYSIPFFLGAGLAGQVPNLELPQDLRRLQRGVSADPANRLIRDAGANHLKARLRSHPDVARAYYADLL